MLGSEAVTRGIRVEVSARYSPDHSRPGNQWFFLYTVTISNEGEDTVQLVSRHWVITDGAGEVEEVEGPGVVGEQPVLEPGDSYQYTSGCPLPTPFGSPLPEPTVRRPPSGISGAIAASSSRWSPGRASARSAWSFGPDPARATAAC